QAARAAPRCGRRDVRGPERAHAPRHRPRPPRRSRDGGHARRRHEQPGGARAVRRQRARGGRAPAAPASPVGDRRGGGRYRERDHGSAAPFFPVARNEAAPMTAWRRSALVVGAAVAAAAAESTPTLGAQSIPIKAGITVAPDSVRIGDPFRVTVGIRAPRGATIEFPRATDSTSAVQSLDPVVVRTAADTTAVEQYADYRVAAWDIGVQRIRLADAIVRYNGADRRVPLSGDSIVVRSLLPKDTAQRVPKPPRALFELNAVPWWL